MKELRKPLLKFAVGDLSKFHDSDVGSDVLLLELANGEPVATAYARKEPCGYKIGRLAISPKHEAKGIATDFINYLKQRYTESLEPGQYIYFVGFAHLLPWYEKHGAVPISKPFMNEFFNIPSIEIMYSRPKGV